MSDIPPITPKPINPNAKDYADQNDIVGKSTEFLSNISALFANSSVNVTTMPGRTDQSGTPNGPTTIPSLDNPDDIKQLEENLEALIAYLQLENDEKQAEMAKERIKVNKDSLETEHKERKEKIDESIKKMDDAAKSRLVNRIFGWIGAFVAVAAAVAAVAFTIVTGGAGAVAAGFAIAGAVVAVTSLVLSETGAMDKLTEALAKTMEDSLGKENAKLAAALIINLSIMAISLGCSIGGMVGGAVQAGCVMSDMVRTVAKVVQTGISIGGTALGVGLMAASATSMALGYEAEMAQADVTELERLMQELQRRLDESEEELNAILEAIQNALGQIAAILASATDTQTEIASQMGQMA